ncbi:Putative protein without homology [Lacticaseibacillus rhamnosus GG]|nr:Putative protein without homology [Lacticaseibacillus rhamnosus GG]
MPQFGQNLTPAGILKPQFGQYRIFPAKSVSLPFLLFKSILPASAKIVKFLPTF